MKLALTSRSAVGNEKPLSITPLTKLNIVVTPQIPSAITNTESAQNDRSLTSTRNPIRMSRRNVSAIMGHPHEGVASWDDATRPTPIRRGVRCGSSSVRWRTACGERSRTVCGERSRTAALLDAEAVAIHERRHSRVVADHGRVDPRVVSLVGHDRRSALRSDQPAVGDELKVAVDEVTVRAVFRLSAFAATDRRVRVGPAQLGHGVLHGWALIAQMPVQLFVNER